MPTSHQLPDLSAAVVDKGLICVLPWLEEIDVSCICRVMQTEALLLRAEL